VIEEPYVPKVVPKPVVVPKAKTPEDIAAEKRSKLAEEQAEIHRQKKKQTQLAKLAAEMAKAEARKAQVEAEAESKAKLKQEKPAVVEKKGKKGSTLAVKEQSSNTSIMVVGIFAVIALLAFYFWFLQ